MLTLENKALHTFLSRVLITWPRSQVQVRLHTQHCYLCARAKEQNVGVSDKGVGLGLSLLVLHELAGSGMERQLLERRGSDYDFRIKCRERTQRVATEIRALKTQLKSGNQREITRNQKRNQEKSRETPPFCLSMRSRPFAHAHLRNPREISGKSLGNQLEITEIRKSRTPRRPVSYPSARISSHTARNSR